MSWFGEQLETRRNLDQEQVENAYARLADAVTGGKRFTHPKIDDVAAADSAIAVILRYFGEKPVTVSESTTDPGERIDEAMRACGIMKRPVVLEDGWWKDATGPYLGTLETGEPIAIIPVGLRGYGYVEPETGRKVRLNERTASDVSKDAYCFYRPLPEKSLTISDLVAFMLRSLDLGDYVRVVLATLAVSLVGLLPAAANELLFDRVIPSGEPTLILPICVLLLGAFISQALIGIARTMVATRLSLKLSNQVEAALMARILMLPTSFFKNREAGEVAQRVSSVSYVILIISDIVLQSGLTAFFSLVYFVQIFAYAPSLAVPALLVILAQLVVGAIATVTQVHMQREIMEKRVAVSGLTPALLNGISKVKLSGAEKRAFARWANVEAEFLAAQYDRPFWYRIADTTPSLVALIGTIIIYWFAGTSDVSLASFMAFNVAYGFVSAAVVGLSGMAGRLAEMQSQIEATRPLLEQAPESSALDKSVENISGAIELSNVTFRYGEGQEAVLENLSLKISAGEYLAIVGKSGSGKSTLLRLLLGFETPERGAVYYSGQDLSEMDVRSLRRVIGVCMQNGMLFAGDIFSNITISAPRATMDDAWAAAEIAGVADDIRAMPMGMYTLISEGSGGVSGGQRQRILIARAVCSKPRILIFDEATSALDNITQKHVSDALSELKCTRVVVAHRLSTIKLADRIVMLDGGKVVEEGTYDELVARGGEFSELVKRQRLES